MAQQSPTDVVDLISASSSDEEKEVSCNTDAAACQQYSTRERSGKKRRIVIPSFDLGDDSDSEGQERPAHVEAHAEGVREDLLCAAAPQDIEPAPSECVILAAVKPAAHQRRIVIPRFDLDDSDEESDSDSGQEVEKTRVAHTHAYLHTQAHISPRTHTHTRRDEGMQHMEKYTSTRIHSLEVRQDLVSAPAPVEERGACPICNDTFPLHLLSQVL